MYYDSSLASLKFLCFSKSNAQSFTLSHYRIQKGLMSYSLDRRFKAEARGVTSLSATVNDVSPFFRETEYIWRAQNYVSFAKKKYRLHNSRIEKASNWLLDEWKSSENLRLPILLIWWWRKIYKGIAIKTLWMTTRKFELLLKFEIEILRRVERQGTTPNDWTDNEQEILRFE